MMRKQPLKSSPVKRLRVLLSITILLAVPEVRAPRASVLPKELSEYLHQVWQRAQGLPQDTVAVITQTRDGYLWLGTQEGLVRLNHGPVQVISGKDGLARSDIQALYEDRSGALWIGTEDGFVYKYAGGSPVPVRFGLEAPGENVMSIREDFEGSIWIGTYLSGLHRLWQGKFANLTARQGLPGEGVRTVYQARNGDIWIGTEASGVSRFDGKSFTNYSLREGLPSGVVRALYEDSKGSFWVGTRGGLALFTQGKFRSYGAAEGLDPPSVRAIIEDKSGTLWIGTSTGGVFRFVRGRFVRVNDGAGVFQAQMIRSLFCDHEGAVWIGSNDSLMRWQNESAKGVVVINPENLGRNSLPPPVVIERAVVNRISLPLDRPAAVPPGSGQAEFDFTGLSFIAPQKVRFKFMLEGQEKEWAEAGTRRQTTYTNLWPGKYVFRVIACNNDELWNTKGARCPKGNSR